MASVASFRSIVMPCPGLVSGDDLEDPVIAAVADVEHPARPDGQARKRKACEALADPNRRSPPPAVGRRGDDDVLETRRDHVDAAARIAPRPLLEESFRKVSPKLFWPLSTSFVENSEQSIDQNGNRRDRVAFHEEPAFEIHLARAIKKVCRANICSSAIRENYFGVNFAGSTLVGIPAPELSGMVGDIIMGEEFTGNLWQVHWSGSQFETTGLHL